MMFDFPAAKIRFFPFRFAGYFDTEIKACHP